MLRKDKGMMGGYIFVMDFLETVTAETSKVVSRQQGCVDIEGTQNSFLTAFAARCGSCWRPPRAAKLACAQR